MEKPTVPFFYFEFYFTGYDTYIGLCKILLSKGHRVVEGTLIQERNPNKSFLRHENLKMKESIIKHISCVHPNPLKMENRGI